MGYGARSFADGIDAVYLIANENYPAEFLDLSYPVRLLRYGINPDSGGPGRWRGGCGVVREIEVLAEEAMLSIRIDSVDNPPWGVAGGQSGRGGRCVINPGRGDERVIVPMSDGTILRRGDVLRIETGGGGGHGHPFDREPEQVRRDVRGGFVSRESARERLRSGALRGWARDRSGGDRAAPPPALSDKALPSQRLSRRAAMTATADAVTIELVKGALRAALAETEALLARTAMSDVIREKKDFFTGFFDATGRIVSATPIPLLAHVIDPILRQYPAETMRPGDLYWYNDCYASDGGVSHLNDQVFAAPVFAEGRLAGFAQSWAHFTDIGGMKPGSMSPDTTEIFQEGSMVPPVRLYREGVLNEEIFRIFARNSRYPLHAQGRHARAGGGGAAGRAALPGALRALRRRRRARTPSSASTGRPRRSCGRSSARSSPPAATPSPTSSRATATATARSRSGSRWMRAATASSSTAPRATIRRRARSTG